MEILHDFELYLQGRGLTERTINSYKTSIRRFVLWVEQRNGNFDPAAITPFDVADYRRQLLEKGRKPATINHALDVLSSFFKWSISEGTSELDPTIDMKRIKEQNNAPRWLGRRELGAFIRSVQKYGNLRDIALVMLLLHTGLRISEAVVLRLEDVIIRERSGLVKVRYGKGNKYREIPLNITVRRVLEGYKGDIQGDWLFPGCQGSYITTRAAEKMLNKFSRLAGVDVTPHMLRQTFGKMLVDAGESLDRVAALMGHSNLNTTARYTRPSVQDLEYAVEKLAWE